MTSLLLVALGHRRRGRIGGLAAGIVAICSLALLPTGALASTANVRIERVFYTAANGELNDLRISASSSTYTLDDAGAHVDAGPGCNASGNTGTCPSAGIRGITVSLGDGADSVRNETATPSTLSGGDGNDSLVGGSGPDILRGNKGIDTQSGGAGDDFIDSRGDKGDIIQCGDGNDTVMADATDTVASDCEVVDRGGAPPPPPPSPAATGLLGPGEAHLLKPGACITDVLGTPGSDTLTGSATGDSLFGLQGNDVLQGQQGDDCLFGGIGNDRLVGAEGADRLLGDDSGNGPRGNDSLSGDDGDDLLVGGPGRDRLHGDAGDDRLQGGRGNDRLSAGSGSNRLSGGSGNDRLSAANGTYDRLNCGPGRRDRARADRKDRVRGCERVRRVG
jgi:Ca2+-binding RTX toxin-like protein